jgi:pimeloyl-ACP methyl ester carboxylesterase
MPYVMVNELKFYYRDDDFTDPWEESEVVFIQHGWGRSSKFFYHWVPGLARNYRVLRRDMRGHGQSDDAFPASDWTVDDLIEDMRGFLDELGVAKVHYIGESAGGVFGAAFAAKYPERVGSLTLMSTPLADPTRGSDKYGYTDLAAKIESTPIDEFVQMLVKGRGLVPVSPGHEQWMASEWRKNRPASLAALARMFPGVDLTPLVSNLAVPTLILAPANSHTAPLEDQKRMHQLIRGSRMEIIDGSGHELYFERFNECFAAFRSFLASVGTRAKDQA